MTMKRTPYVLLVALVGAACAAAAVPEGGASSIPAPTAPRQEALVPPGHGTLKQDEVTLSLRSGPLLIKVTPLAEQVTRLLAPDTYTRLHNLAENRRAEVSANTLSTPELFLVSFFSYQPNVTFQPEDVQLVSQGRLLRPIAIAPVTSGWGSQTLNQQDNQTAIYAFEGPIDYDQVFTLRYGMEETEAWRSLIPKLRAERNRVQSRAGGGNDR